MQSSGRFDVNRNLCSNNWMFSKSVIEQEINFLNEKYLAQREYQNNICRKKFPVKING